MSDNVLKASIRQTLACIEAYDVDLLRAIEASFKEALHNCNDEDEDETVTAKQQGAPASPAAPPPTPQPMPTTTPPTKTVNAAAPVELFELPAWHYRLPLIVTISTTALLFILAR